MSGRNKKSENAWRHARWLLDYFLREQKCYFCGEPLVDHQLKAREWWQLPKTITLHHIDFNHNNNVVSNLTPAHRTCHRRSHIRERAGKENWMRLEEES